MQYILGAILIIFPFLINANGEVTSNSAPDNSNPEPSIFEKINQNIILDHCKIKAVNGALYLCANKSYLLMGERQESRFLQMRFQINTQVIDGDMDNNNLVVVDHSSLTLIRDLYYVETNQINNQVPIFVRIKSRSHYIFTAMLSRTIRPFENFEGLVEPLPKETFLINTFIQGPISNSHRFLVPIDSLNYRASQDSFIDAVLVDDMFYGKEHLIIAMKGGWIQIFRTLFQDSEIEAATVLKLEENHEIINLSSKGPFLFAFLYHQESKQGKVMIYRMNTLSDMKLQKECELIIGKNIQFNNLKPELRVKKFEKTYVLLVNFPTDEILIYHFQESPLGTLRPNCPEKFSHIEYSTIGKEYGYSFEYIVNFYLNGFIDHGIILSPVNPSATTSLFIRYCLPNTFWSENLGCMFCSDGYNEGGSARECLKCQTDEKHSLIPGYDVMKNTCPMVCNQQDKFGDQCLPCEQYMGSMNITLPQKATWGLDPIGQCGFKCDDGVPDYATGNCISNREFQIKADHCAQITDCVNCSLSQTCSWCDNSCKQISNCTFGKAMKSSISQDFLDPALNCNLNDVCGERVYSNESGSISFKTDILQKNQICTWNIQPSVMKNYLINIRLNVQGLVIDELHNPLSLYIAYCSYNNKTRVCESFTILLKNEFNAVDFMASDIHFLFWTDHTVSKAMDSFVLEYALNEIDDENESLPLKLTFHFISICVLISLLLSSLKRFQSNNRRRRLLLELQEIGDFDPLQDGEGEQPVNVEEILSNNRIVCRITYDENTMNEYQQTECSICLDEFKKDENLAKFACKHIFHSKCFEDWARAAAPHSNVKCPICNRILA